MLSPSDADLVKLLADRVGLQAHQIAAVMRVRFDPSGTESLAEAAIQLGFVTREQLQDLLASAPGWAEAGTTLRDPRSRDFPPVDVPPGTVISTPPTSAPQGGARPDPGPTRVDSEFGGAPPPDGLGSGARFGPYVILRELGRGGMGVVYLAEETGLRRRVALKTLLVSPQWNPGYADRLIQEARTAAALDHPGTVPIYDVGVQDGVPYFAMAYVEGTSLHDLLYSNRLGGLRERVGVVRDVAEVVAHAHERRVIHRDLKPGNVLVEDGGRVRVMDFGLARQMDRSTRLTVDGEIFGTPAYMSPEQIEGEQDRIGPTTDVYALGAILYEVLTKRTPFEGAGPIEIIHKALRYDPAPPDRHDARIPPDLCILCLKALRKEPSDRYPTARDFADDLGRYLSGEAVSARPWGPWERMWRAMRRRKAWSAMVGGLITLAATVSVLLWHAQRSENERRGLQQKVVDSLQQVSAVYLDAALRLRRKEATVAELAEMLGPLQESAAAALREAPSRPEPHHHLGRLQRALGNAREAETEQTAALEVDARHAGALYERAVLRAYAYRSRVAELRAIWIRRQAALAAAKVASEGVSAVAPSSPPDEAVLAGADPEAQILRRGLRMDLERLAEAESSPTPADPGGAKPSPVLSPRVASARGHLLVFGGRPEDQVSGMDLLRRAIADDPRLEEAYEALGFALEWAGRYDEALALYDEAIAADRGYIAFRLRRAAVRWNRADALNRMGADPDAEFELAEADLARALNLNPASRDARVLRAELRLARARTRAGRGEDAREIFAGGAQDADALIRTGPEARYHLLRGALRMEWAGHQADGGEDPRPQFIAALEDFDEAERREPGTPEPALARAMLLAAWAGREEDRGGDPAAMYERAEAEFGRALGLDPRSLDAWIGRGQCRALWALHREERRLDAESHYARAEEDFEAALRLAPANPDLRIRRGNLRMNRAIGLGARGGDPLALLEQAYAEFEAARAIRPDVPEVWEGRAGVCTNRGAVLRERGEDPSTWYGRAVEDFGRALDLAPHLEDCRSGRATVLMNWAADRHGRGHDPGDLYERAEEDMGEVIRRNPASARGWALRARIRIGRAGVRLDRGEAPTALLEQAIEDLGQAIERNPRLPEAWEMRGEALYLRGWCAQDSGEEERTWYRRAMEDFRHLVKIHPGWTPGWDRLGIVLSGLAELDSTSQAAADREFGEAIAAFDRALTPNPSQAGVWERRGRTLWRWAVARVRTGVTEENLLLQAEESYRRSVELAPHRVSSRAGRAEARSALLVLRQSRGEKAEDLARGALDDFSAAMGASPEDPGLYRRRGSLHEMLEQWGDAVADFEAARRLDPFGPDPALESWIDSLERLGRDPERDPRLALLRGERDLSAGAVATARAGLERGLGLLDALPRAAGADAAGDAAVWTPARGRAHYGLARLHARAIGRSQEPASDAAPAAPVGSARDRAFHHLAEAVRWGWNDREQAREEPDFRPLHEDPRWAAALGEMR